MATLLAGGFFASRALFKYNRKNFMFDKKLKQKREFQEQDMRIEQFSLYREDVRDLVELTVAKMDLYLVASALLVDRTTVMIAKANEALPPGSPEWAVALHAMSLASSVFYLLLCLWLAMYASVSAQSFGTRLLTQFVRLPYASQDQIQNASAEAAQFEETDLTELMRVPLVRAGLSSAKIREPRIAQVASASSSAAPAAAPSAASRASEMTEGDPDILVPNQALLPTSMLDHIRLYRRVQLNWQAYDAYARVCLFVGANSLLYSCLYWALGAFLQDEHATIPAVATAVVFATVQALLCKLDLRLRTGEMFWIGLLLATTPIVTTSGMMIFKDLDGRKDPPEWEVFLMEMCAVVAHVLHTVVALLTLSASWPDSERDEDALLPSKFRSTLYLDVFGWLLNPTGPGTADHRDESEEDAEEDAAEDGGQGREGPSEEPGTPSSRGRVQSDFSEAQQSSALGGPQPTLSPPQSRSSSGQLAPRLQRSISPQAPFQRSQQARSRGPSPGPSAVEAGNPVQVSRAASKRHASYRSSAGESSQTGHVRWGNLPSPGTRPRSSFTADFSDDIKREARRLLHPDSLHSEAEGTQEERFGGSESIPIEVVAGITAPSAAASATFTQAVPPRRVSRKTPLPGATPWSAFLRGTVVIVTLWALSTLWTIAVLFVGGWGYSNRNSGHVRDKAGRRILRGMSELMFEAFLTPPVIELTSSISTSDLFVDAICAGGRGILHQQMLRLNPQQRHLQQPLRRHQQRVSWLLGAMANQSAMTPSEPLTVLDLGCGLHRPFVDLSIACDGSSRCTVVVLQRGFAGGRKLSLCRLQTRGRALVVRAVATARLVTGAPSLQTLTVTFGQGKPSELRVFGRTEQPRHQEPWMHEDDDQQQQQTADMSGSLVAFRLQGLRNSSFALIPEYVVDQPATSGLEQSLKWERLFIANGILVSVSPLQQEGSRSCDAHFVSFPGGVQLRAWKLATGESSSLALPETALPQVALQVSHNQRLSTSSAMAFLRAVFGCPLTDAETV